MPSKPSRPDPDQLLAQVQADEQAAQRGKLKIFLGYAAGVGKTYAMLEAAHQRKEEGVDIVIGYVETHKRVETEELVAELEVIPRKAIEYHNVTLTEMDVDAVLSRRPALALVDELAHTNAPGSRHPKRFQDVEELLDAGIDIYTTLNIQHLESLNDVVAQVTGVIVRETVPDRVIDMAAEIEVIDLPPDELLVRLKEGKVYIPEQANRAIEKFFRKGNLTALREMSLRRAAERVDIQMRAYMRSVAIPGPWAAGERLLVCISPSPLAEKLIRTTRRLADEINAEWFAVYVNLVSRPELDAADSERISQALQLAEELGGRTRLLAGRTIPEAVLAYARKHNVTKILVGKPLRPRWRELLTGSVVDQFIRSGGNIDIYVISSRQEKTSPFIPSGWKPHSSPIRYLISLVLVGIVTVIGFLVRSNLEPVNLVMLYLAAVVISSIFLGRGPSLLATIAGILTFDFFLVQPYLTFAVSNTQYVITFVVFFVVSLVISALTAQVREQADAAIIREEHTAVLFELSRDLNAATDLKGVAGIILTHISRVFGREAAIFLPENSHLKSFASTTGFNPGENELAVASWSFEHKQPAGRGTDTLPAAALRCLPLQTVRGIVGVLGVRPSSPSRLMSAEERQVLSAFANQAALAIERASLDEQARQAELLQATEKLQTALLNSISHDLRTPLVSITGALSSLSENDPALDEKSRSSLIETARGEADRLNRLVGNLLNMTRLEAGAMRINFISSDVQDVIGAALEQLGERLDARPVKVDVPSSLPFIPMDFALFVQALVNLLDNAIKYSPPEKPIEIRARQTDDVIEIGIYDEGVGIPKEDLERVFDKFYRVQRPEQVTGTGLGLAISKGIVEAHRGRIWAANRKGGGTVITIQLPIGEK